MDLLLLKLAGCQSSERESRLLAWLSLVFRRRLCSSEDRKEENSQDLSSSNVAHPLLSPPATAGKLTEEKLSSNAVFSSPGSEAAGPSGPDSSGITAWPFSTFGSLLGSSLAGMISSSLSSSLLVLDSSAWYCSWLFPAVSNTN